MARTLHLLAWISVVTAAAYKYPGHPPQLSYALFPIEPENQETFRSGSYARLSPRSPEVSQQARIDEGRAENGTLKGLQFYKNGRRGPVDSNQITFPGPTAMPLSRQFVPEIPDACKGSTFCENVPNYPQEEIDRLINEAGNSFSPQIDELGETPDITQRLGPTEDHIELCNLIEKVVYPQSVLSTDGMWYALVNRKSDPVQGFKVEICQNDGEKCSDVIVALQEKYSARCMQKYVLRTAQVMVMENGQSKIVERHFKIPSCCSCVAKYNLD